MNGRNLNAGKMSVGSVGLGKTGSAAGMEKLAADKGTVRKELLRTIKYFMIASSAGLIEISLYTLLDFATPLPYWPAYLIALVASVLWNFTLNRRYTFRAANKIAPAMLKVAAYYAVFTPLSTILGNYLAEDLLWNSVLVTLINILINGVTEFLYQRFFVFGKAVDTRPTVISG